jgi:uncharacterized protein HemX
VEASSPKPDPSKPVTPGGAAGAEGAKDSPGPATGTGAAAAADPEGLRAWLAQIERKLGIRTYAGAALLVIALAAAIVALVMALDARDNSASKTELSRLADDLGSVQEQASGAESAQQDVDSLSSRVSAAEDRLDQIEGAGGDASSQIKVLQDDVEDLRQQIADLESSSSSTGGTSTNTDESTTGGGN